jgi:hypothetical protein
MTVTGTMIITRGGSILPLDQRRRDALMIYAQQAADMAGVPRQAWCRRVWKLKDYEAKDLLKGNASETVWERIMKMRGPHCGWAVALPVVAAVVGQDLHDFFRDQMRHAAREAEDALEDERLATAAWRRLAGDLDRPGDDRGGSTSARQTGRGAGAVGAEGTRRVDGGSR